MPDLTILGRKVYFDRQLVAELHPSLVEGTTLHGEFLALLQFGADYVDSPEFGYFLDHVADTLND